MTKTNINIFDVIFNVSSEKFGETETEFFSKIGARTLVIEKEGMKLFALSADGSRNIPYIGQATRTAQLIKAIEEKDEKIVRSITLSILDQQMEKVSIMVFRKIDIFCEFVTELSTFRRSSFLQAGRDQLAYILSEGEDINNVLASVEYLEDIPLEDRDICFRPAAIKDTDTWISILETITEEVKSNKGSELEFLGGSPDNGLLLFSSTKKPASVGAAQKLAKIMMAGGVVCNNLSIEFTLTKFPKEVDGVFSIISDEISRSFNEYNAIKGSVYQTRMFKDGLFAIKGTMTTPKTRMLGKIINNEKAVLDVNEYNKTFGLSMKAGDKVSINDVLIMSTDADCGIRPIRLSNQILSRVPEDYRSGLLDIAMEEIARMAVSAETDPKRFLPKFGIYSTMRDITPIEFKNVDYQKSAEKELRYKIRTIVRKGIQVDGAYLYHLPEEGLSFNECLISRRYADRYNIKIGDSLGFFVYPALLAENNKNSNFIFSKKVAGFLEVDAVSLSYEAAKAAQRDWDGDKIVVTHIFNLGEQSNADYSITLAGNRDPLLAEQYSEYGAIRAFVKLGSSIGIIDWWIETATKMYSNLNHNFLNNCLQADIFSKKHQVIDGYGVKDLKKYLQENAPAMWAGNKVVQHEDIIARKTAKDVNFDVDSIDISNMSLQASIVTMALQGISLGKIKTQTQDEFRSKARRLLKPFQSKVLSMRDMKSAIVSYSRSFTQDINIDTKKAAFSNLGRELKMSIGDESFTMLLMYLLISEDEFSSVFFPLVMGDRSTLQLIDSSKHLMFAGEVKTTTIANTFKAWRPRLVNEDGSIDDRTPSITIAEFKAGDKITVKNGKIVMQNPANINGICADGVYTIKSCTPAYSQGGVLLKTGVTISI